MGGQASLQARLQPRDKRTIYASQLQSRFFLHEKLLAGPHRSIACLSLRHELGVLNDGALILNSVGLLRRPLQCSVRVLPECFRGPRLLLLEGEDDTRGCYLEGWQ